MLRIILLVGNISIFILPIIGLNFSINDPETPPLIFGILVPLIILSALNIYFIIGTYRGPVSLYLKRKKLEEEIKIQEAENKLKDLQSQGLASSIEETKERKIKLNI